ncbi:MAG TPA: hypothetical protein VFQ53_38465 [Kofleriaceae bacterium]|nr:hypothetical protein [Kofleriaceae bacterium]
MEARPNPPPKSARFWVALQPSIVRLYKVAGLVALTAILIGLIGFLIVNIFYFFDHSWVRPQRYTSQHEKVLEISSQLADAKLRASQLQVESTDIKAQLAEIDRGIQMDKDFLLAVSTQADAPKSPEQWMLKREVDRARLEQENLGGRRPALVQRLDSLKQRIAEQEGAIKRLEGSPYLKANTGPIVMAFVPYENKDTVAVGTRLYRCSWGIVGCSESGKVIAIYKNEETTNKHPHNDRIMRGFMVEIDVSSDAADDAVLFAGGKPLWLF